ncbi:MAG: hypothetical protein HF978_19400 [Desulfobacteraceae bacterium]|nr:peptidoglycan-binding protein [Desulfobacteraceae bacterium]MBC2757717.1 hypothetical protein [Desulfobacteraceae bacterium]
MIMRREMKRILYFFILTVSILILSGSEAISEENQYHSIYNAQKKLIEKGYQPGLIDGTMGEKTKEAIMEFQKDNGLPITGNLDVETEKKLLGNDAVIKNSTFDHVHQFQSFFEDSPISSTLYMDTGLSYGDYDHGSLFGLGTRGGYPILPKFEINGALNLLFVDFDHRDSESGLSDLYVGGKYNFYDEKTKMSAGGYITLPIGSEDVGQDNFNYGIYCALRHPVNNKVVITGTAGLSIIEHPWSSDDETSIALGGGCIYAESEQLYFIGELLIKTEIDYMMISGGMDYSLNNKNKIRSALGLGFDDGAPDVQLWLSFLFSL